MHQIKTFFCCMLTGMTVAIPTSVSNIYGQAHIQICLPRRRCLLSILGSVRYTSVSGCTSTVACHFRQNGLTFIHYWHVESLLHFIIRSACGSCSPTALAALMCYETAISHFRRRLHSFLLFQWWLWCCYLISAIVKGMQGTRHLWLHFENSYFSEALTELKPWIGSQASGILNFKKQKGVAPVIYFFRSILFGVALNWKLGGNTSSNKYDGESQSEVLASRW